MNLTGGSLAIRNRKCLRNLAFWRLLLSLVFVFQYLSKIVLKIGLKCLIVLYSTVLHADLPYLVIFANLGGGYIYIPAYVISVN